MKKIFPIFCTLLLAGGSPLWAAYAKIGDYRDVEVVNVTWRGIEVLHRDGGCILTEKDLSDADKATLKKELEQHRQLLKEQQARWEERRKELEKDIPAIYEMLKKGSEEAEKVAAQTLADVKAAMKINYFDDLDLIRSQAERYGK